jgi:hypothetical protein
VLATSQRRGSVLPRSHKDTARKAFGRVTKRVLPGSYTRLQRALTAEARAYARSLAELEALARTERTAAAAQDGAEGCNSEPQGACDLDEVSGVDEDID